MSTRGRHAGLRRLDQAGTVEILTIPIHREIAPGTLHAIYRRDCRFVPEERLRPLFFR